MSKRTCKLSGCQEPVRSVGYCELHYKRLQRHGDPSAVFRQGRRAKHKPCICPACDPGRYRRGA